MDKWRFTGDEAGNMERAEIPERLVQNSDFILRAREH